MVYISSKRDIVWVEGNKLCKIKYIYILKLLNTNVYVLGFAKPHSNFEHIMCIMKKKHFIYIKNGKQQTNNSQEILFNGIYIYVYILYMYSTYCSHPKSKSHPPISIEHLLMESGERSLDGDQKKKRKKKRKKHKNTARESVVCATDNLRHNSVPEEHHSESQTRLGSSRKRKGDLLSPSTVIVFIRKNRRMLFHHILF